MSDTYTGSQMKYFGGLSDCYTMIAVEHADE